MISMRHSCEPLLMVWTRGMKNIAVFGASKVLGQCVVEHALDKGFAVRVLLRDPNHISKGCQKRVEIVNGDVVSIVDVQRTLEGQDAAVMVLELQNNGSITLESEGWKNIISVLEGLEINVVSIFISAPETSDSEYRRILRALEDSSLHWVVAKTFQVVDQPSSGYLIVRHGGSSGSSISRSDLAQFLVDALSMPEHYQKIVPVCSYSRKCVYKHL